MTLDQLSAAAKDISSKLGPFKFNLKRQDNYSGEHREWNEELTLPVGAALTEQIVLEALRTGQLVAVTDDAIERYRHVKRGTVYEVVGEAELQMNADCLVDGSQMMVYRGEDGKLWCRHYDEFHDGRFEALAAKGDA